MHAERRRIGRRVTEPYFKIVGSHLRESLIMAGLFLLVVWLGWYFQI